MSCQTLHIVCGTPGAGKSTYGRTLARQRGALLLDLDTASEPVVRAGLTLAGLDPDDRDSPTYKQAFREPIYAALLAIASENLDHLSVVIVGPFTRELRDPDWPTQLSQQLNAPVELHYLHCDRQERYRRLVARGNPRDRAKLADWENFLRYYGDETPPAGPHHWIDTSLAGSATDSQMPIPCTARVSPGSGG